MYNKAGNKETENRRHEMKNQTVWQVVRFNRRSYWILTDENGQSVDGWKLPTWIMMSNVRFSRSIGNTTDVIFRYW